MEVSLQYSPVNLVNSEAQQQNLLQRHLSKGRVFSNILKILSVKHVKIER